MAFPQLSIEPMNINADYIQRVVINIVLLHSASVIMGVRLLVGVQLLGVQHEKSPLFASSPPVCNPVKV